MKAVQMTYILVLLSCALGTSACDVHEFPEIPESKAVQVDINYHLDFTGFTMWEHLHDGDNIYEVGFGEKYHNIHDQGTTRYIVRAYPKSEKQRTAQDYAKEFVFTRTVSDGYDCDFPLDLAPGNYTIMVWSDFIRNGDDEHFYNADNFAEITLQGEYCGNSDYRDAFRGVADVVLPADAREHEDIVLDINMQRPLAKYEFITTDLSEFLDKERIRFKNTTKAESNIEDYKVVFYYVGFMPDTYNMFTDKPVDSATGVLFESKLDNLSGTEASVGFDYVFVNGAESAVTVQIGIYDNDGTQLSLTNPIEVPLKRGHHTVMKGMFLTQEASGGVNINPDFDDEYNIEIKKIDNNI